MTTCSDHEAPRKADHPLTLTSPTMCDAPAPKPAEGHADATSAPPRSEESAQLPAKGSLLAPRAPDTRSASNPLLLEGIEKYVGSIFRQLHAQLPRTIAALAEPPPAPDPSFASQLIGFVVESATGLVLGGVGSAFAVATKKAFGELTIEPFKGALKAGSGAAGAAMAAGGLTPGIPGNDSLPAVAGAGGFANPAAKTLLEEFQARQFNRLTLAEADAAFTLGGVAERLSTFVQADLERLLVELRTAAEGDAGYISAQFSNQLTVGWMNLAATLALGPRPSRDAPHLAGARDPEGPQGRQEMAAWHGAHHGFIEVAVHLPELLHGTQGLALGEVSVPTSPGTARMLQRTGLPLLGLPVYRRITLVQGGQGKLGRDPAVVITPDGTVECNLANEQLAAIGAGVATALEDTRGRFGETFSASLRATYAINGALRIAAWLGPVSSSVIK